MADSNTIGDGQVNVQEKTWSKQEVADFLSEINNTLVASDNANLHSLLAVNRLLTIPNVDAVFDEDLRTQAKDIWVKLKSTGVQLADPPFLFGIPKIAERVTEVDKTEVIIFEDDDETTPPVKEKSTRSSKSEDKLPQ